MPLSNDEWKRLFDIIDGGVTKLTLVQQKFRQWDRVTVARAFNVASELYRSGDRTIDTEKADRIAEKAKYNATRHFVEQAFSQYLQWLETKGDTLSQHRRELAVTAREIAPWLRNIKNYYATPDEDSKYDKSLEDKTVGDLAVSYDETDMLDFMHDAPARYLLTHMKSQFHDLESLRTWADLEIASITDELLNALDSRARTKEFEGMCEVCEGHKHEQ